MFSELLLPAGNWDSLKAAVANGADAVYLSGRRFGARASADNFDREELRNAVKLCRRHGLKIYITVNTLLFDDEMPEVLEYAKFLYDSGVDALIVQDIGLAGALRKLLPSLPLHASTQMTIHNVHDAKWAYDFGFKRVILSRECSLGEIKAIHEALPELELEAFCHGALCICYSGRCLMSSLIGGRSGNRGMCAQPCRLPYELCDAYGNSLSKGNSHLLSPRELQTLDDLRAMLEAGICSFKIEGRMRRPEYVATVGRVYRKALDGINGGKICDNKEGAAQIAQVFNRKFTKGYLYGNPGARLMSFDKPNNRGVSLGRVSAADSKKTIIELSNMLRIHDGIEVWVKIGGRKGTEISTLKINGKEVKEAAAGTLCEIQAIPGVRRGDRVFKTNDSLLMAEAEESINNLDCDIPLVFSVYARLGQRLRIEAATALENTEDINNNYNAVCDTSYIVEEALKHPADRDSVTAQLSRLGGTGYKLKDVILDMDDNIMLPASVLNKYRRFLTEQLEAKSGKRYPAVPDKAFAYNYETDIKVRGSRKKNNISALAVKVNDINKAEAAFKGGADRIYFDESSGYAFLDEKATEDWQRFNALHKGKCLYVLPAVMREDDRDLIAGALENAVKAGFTGFLCSHAGDIVLKDKYPELDFYADYGCNVTNLITAEELSAAGFKGVTASLELSKEQLKHLSKSETETEVFVHGAMPMMVSRHCLIGAAIGKNRDKVPCGRPCHGTLYYLKDRKNENFPVMGDLYHSFNIYNCRELCLLDEVSHLDNFNFWRIEAQLMDLGTITEVVSLYKAARDDAGDNRELLAAEIGKYTLWGYTRGHFNRGINKE